MEDDNQDAQNSAWEEKARQARETFLRNLNDEKAAGPSRPQATRAQAAAAENRHRLVSR